MSAEREDPAFVADEARKMHAPQVDHMAAKGLTPGVSDTDFVAWWENELLGG